MTRFIIITGGVVSSLGKGLATASLGALLQARGYTVRLCKMDPYLNVDPGTMSPFQHGEVYVTDDGAETDLDLGHYERFTGQSSTAEDSTTTGRIYQTVLQKERRGDYLGATLQVVPHITDNIKSFWVTKDGSADFVLCEIGGTVGDIESLPFLEAARQFRHDFGLDRVMNIHVTLVPYIAAAGELKTKPTQHSVKELMGYGIMPNILLCRSERPLSEADRAKIAQFTNLSVADVIPAYDAGTIYEVPLLLHAQGLDKRVLDHFGVVNQNEPQLNQWISVCDAILNPSSTVRIAVIGKYTGYIDSYKSLVEALTHGGLADRVKVALTFIDAEGLEQGGATEQLMDYDAILVPGGFGSRGTEGMIRAIETARTQKIPFLGICLGFQMAVVEAMRHALGYANAGSIEMGLCDPVVVGRMSEWTVPDGSAHRVVTDDLGGSMRLGLMATHITPSTLAHQIYGQDTIYERHRHRFEINMNFSEPLQNKGFLFSGVSQNGQLPEIGEWRDHPWFVGVQCHPELTSRPLMPHPLFVSFIRAALAHQRRRNTGESHENRHRA